MVYYCIVEHYHNLECILLDLFYTKLHAHSLGSYMQRIGNEYLGRIEVYLGPCQTSMIDRSGSKTSAKSKIEYFVIIVNYNHKVLHLGYCSSPRSASDRAS